MDMLLKNIGVLATPVGTVARAGQCQGEIRVIENAMVGVTDGKFSYVGTFDETLTAASVIDCGGKLMTPGLVDAHTHMVFGGWRQKEMSLKLEGVSYLDILKSGGGILNTVEQTRQATEEELYDKTLRLLSEMMALGVTTCEAKSGYGLDLENELKQLRVIKRVNEGHPADVAATFMGAHAFPKEFENNRGGYVKYIIDEMLPKIAEKGLAKFCDIFTETAVFTIDESYDILMAAKKLGLSLKVHADEIDPIGGAQLAARVGAISAEHLIETSDEGILAMASKGVIAVLLPSTSFYLDKDFARANDMIDAGVAVAIATDFNPGSSPCLNLQFAMNLACLKYKLTPAQALTAVTLNGAAAIDRADICGSIEVGKMADLVIWDADDLDYIFYRYGSNLAKSVMKKGVFYVNHR